MIAVVKVRLFPDTAKKYFVSSKKTFTFACTRTKYHKQLNDVIMKRKSLLCNVAVNKATNAIDYKTCRVQKNGLVISVHIAKPLPYDAIKQSLVDIAKNLKNNGTIADYTPYVTSDEVDFTIDNKVKGGIFNMPYFEDAQSATS